MNKIFLLLLTPLLLLTGAGCDKVLEVPGNAGAQIITSQVFADSSSATAGVIGLYGNTGNLLTSGDLEYYTALSSDVGKTSSASAADADFYMDQVLPGSQRTIGDAGRLWSEEYSYAAIFGANVAIEAINANTDSILSAAVRNQLISECKVLRAMHYLNLVNLFGDVPLVLGSDWRTTALLPRASVDAVYDQIVKDLQDGVQFLPPSYPSAGRQRTNRYVAMGLLARVYLYRKQWALAKVMSDSVINSGLYSLVNNLDNVFLDKSTEAIWQIGSTSTSTPNSAPGTSSYVVTSFSGSFTLAPSMIAAFEGGDKRMDHWVKTVQVFDISTFQFKTIQAQNKYKNNITFNGAGGQEDQMIMRLAELYLIRAEAIAQLGDPVNAMADVNIIRNRAGLSPASASSLAQALGIIQHERHVELFIEWGHRWFDLKRTDSVNSVMSRVKPQYWPADGHAALYPISITELTANLNLVQNPGY